MKGAKYVAVKISERLEKVAMIIACDSKSMLMWGEVPLPECLRKRAKENQAIM